MTRLFRKYNKFVVATIVVTLIALTVLALRPSMASVKWEEEIYRVRSGDSLWSISGEYCPDSVDRQEWINKVRKMNDIDGSIIRPGQMLTILAPAEED